MMHRSLPSSFSKLTAIPSKRFSVNIFRNRDHRTHELLLSPDLITQYRNRLKHYHKPSRYKALRYPPKEAAVLLPLCHINGVPSILFTLRSENLSSHRGEISFPGGMRDPEDTDLCLTALRETEEEIDIHPEHIEILGHLTPVPNRAGTTLVTPYIGLITQQDFEPSRLAFNREEVDKILVFSIEDLVHPDNFGFDSLEYGQTSYQVPRFHVAGWRVWGLTSTILYIFLRDIMFPKIKTPANKL